MKMNQQTTYLPGASADVAFTAAPAAFTPPANIYQMRVVADQNCRITWLNAGTVVVVAGIPEYFPVHPGDPLSVVRETTDGTLNVGWMTN